MLARAAACGQAEHARHQSRPAAAPHLLAVSLQLLRRLDGHGQLAAGADEDVVGRALAAVHDVGALLHTLDGAAGQVGHALARERDGRGPLAVGDGDLVRARRLVAAARAHHQHVGHRAEAGEVLDGLVGGAVLTQADRVVRHHIDCAHLHTGMGCGGGGGGGAAGAGGVKRTGQQQLSSMPPSSRPRAGSSASAPSTLRCSSSAAERAARSSSAGRCRRCSPRGGAARGAAGAPTSLSALMRMAERM